MIRQDGAAQKEIAKNTTSLTISRINVTETNANRVLVVCFAAKGQQVGSSRVGGVTYGGQPMILSAEGTGVVDSEYGKQYGGAWIFTLVNPEAGQDVVIGFHDLIADEIAALATVFYGVDQNTPVGHSEGKYAKTLATQVSPKSPESRYLSVMASGAGGENRFAQTSSATDVLAMAEVELMSLNVAISEPGGTPAGDIGVCFSDDRSKNAIAMVELIPAPRLQVAPRITKIGINEATSPVAVGTTSANGTEIHGKYGVMTIGSDGTYDYLVDEASAAQMSPTDVVIEEFTYLLSDGTNSSTGILPVEVNGPEPSLDAGTGDVTPEGTDLEALAVIEIKFAGGNSLPVQSGTTSENGTRIQGTYGTLTMGADGSYSYLTDKKEAESLSPSDTVEEMFSYVLSNGKQSTVAKLPVVVTGVNEAASSGDAPATSAGDEPEHAYEITEIAAGDSRPVPVTPGTTSTEGATKIAGIYGTLIIGADGSYEYIVNESLAGSNLVAPVEMFNYTLSNGTNHILKELPIAVAVPEAPEFEVPLVEPEIPPEAPVQNPEEPEMSEPVDVAPPPATLEAPPSQPTPPPTPESEVFRLDFNEPLARSTAADFQVAGVPNATVTHVDQISESSFELTVEALDLISYGGNFEIEYVGPLSVEPPPEEKTTEPTVTTMDIEGASNGFFAPEMMVSSGTVTSFSDFSGVQCTTEVELPTVVSTNVASPENSTMLSSQTRMSSMATGDFPSSKRVVSERTSDHQQKEAKAGRRNAKSNSMPLDEIMKLFRDPTDPRFFGGHKVQVGKPGESGVSFIPFFAGAASPGATVLITIRDSFGIEVSVASEVAELSGNWSSYPEGDFEDGTYTITIEETPATWGNAAFPARSLVAEFSGAVNVPPEAMGSLTQGQILGGILRGRSLEEHVTEHASSVDDPNQFTEIK